MRLGSATRKLFRERHPEVSPHGRRLAAEPRAVSSLKSRICLQDSRAQEFATEMWPKALKTRYRTCGFFVGSASREPAADTDERSHFSRWKEATQLEKHPKNLISNSFVSKILPISATGSRFWDTNVLQSVVNTGSKIRFFRSFAFPDIAIRQLPLFRASWSHVVRTTESTQPPACDSSSCCNLACRRSL